MSSDVILPLVLGILVLTIWYFFVFIRESSWSYEANWRELAKRTGLEYMPAGTMRSGKKTPPFVGGTYRGHSIALHRITSSIGYKWWPRSYSVTAYTRFLLVVNNPTNSYLMIRNASAANVQLKKLFGAKGIPTGDALFDKQFFIEKSQPGDFARRVLASAELRHTLQRAFADTTRRHIELTAQRLKLQEVWDPAHMGKRNVDYLHNHLDALVDLAEAIDKQGTG